MKELFFNPADLGPGEAKALGLDVSSLSLHRVSSHSDPQFEPAYALLWEQFGAAGEMESAEVLARRLAPTPGGENDSVAMQYDLLVVQHEGRIVAIHDHTATADERLAMVHLSHVWVETAWRRTGLAGWMRALPLQTARACLRVAGLRASQPVTLVAEMEYVNGVDPLREGRLRAYERAGYRKLATSRLDYRQPDFRPSVEIDSGDGPLLLPMQLVLRRVGHETITELSAVEVRLLVDRLYDIYARDLRPQEVQAARDHVARAFTAQAPVALLPPTA